MLFLVVDDDALSRDLLTLLLEVEGYEVETAVSGAASVARINSCARDGLRMPDVILTDIQMPGLAGDGLAAALRPLLAEQTFLLAMSGSQPSASELPGFDGFLLKPFKVSELKAKIQAVPVQGNVALTVERAKLGQAMVGTDDPGADALDEEVFEKMCELMPAAQLGQMYALCVDDARKRIANMQALAEEGDDAEYRREAHAVKGGCGMIGAKELYELAAEAEKNGLALMEINSGTSSIKTTLAQLSRACDRLERILAERTRE